MSIREATEDEFKRRSWRSQKTNDHARTSVLEFMNTDWPMAYIGKWPIPRTPAARSSATKRAIIDLDLVGRVTVKQANGSVYLIRVGDDLLASQS